MFEGVRSRPSPGAGSNARSGCLRGDSEECRTARAVIEPTYVCLCSSSTPPKVLPATIVCKCRGLRTRNTVGRHKSQRTPGGPGSQGRSALTTGSPGVDSAVAGPPCGQALGRCSARPCAERACRRSRPALTCCPSTRPANLHQRLEHAVRTPPSSLPNHGPSTCRCRLRSHGPCHERNAARVHVRGAPLDDTDTRA